jgi:hypothetical protein
MVEHGSPPLVDPFQVALIVSSYVRHHKIAADQLAGLIVEVHRALASLGVLHRCRSRRGRRCRSDARYIRITSSASNVDFARRCFADICGSRTVSMSLLTAPAGNSGWITR